MVNAFGVFGLTLAVLFLAYVVRDVGKAIVLALRDLSLEMDTFIAAHPDDDADERPAEIN